MFKRLFRHARFLLGVFALAAILFGKAINYPFFQDDFFVLQTTRMEKIKDTAGLIGLLDGTVYWRPLGIQLYFGVLQSINLDSPLAFHMIAFLFHLLNIALVFKLTQVIYHQPAVSRLTAFFYAISPLHYFALGWAVNFSYVFVITLMLAAILLLLSGRPVLSLASALLALATNELSISLPILMLIVILLAKRHGVRVIINHRQRILIAGVFIAVAGYVAWRLFSGMSIEGDYAISLTAPLASLRWYGLWMIGLSDIVRDHMAGLATFRTLFTNSFPEVVFVYTLQIGVMLLVAIGILVQAIRNKDWLITRIFQGGWIIAALSPVLLFPIHLYSHYAAVASIAVYWAVSQMLVGLTSPYNIRIRQGMMGLWLLVAVATLRLNYLASWMGDHARHSLMFSGKIKQYKLDAGPVSSVYLTGLSNKAELVLAGKYGISFLAQVPLQSVYIVESLQDAYALEMDEEDVELAPEKMRQILKQRGAIVIQL